jgi:ferritin-like metal-binding protein YciE
MTHSSEMNEKLVQYFNEALAMENAAVDRNRTRIAETPILLAKQQLKYHLEQTYIQQDRLKDIITRLGGTPTTMKATLPKLIPMNMDTIVDTVKETVKSVVDSDSKNVLNAEKELIQIKEDAIIENAEVVSYKMLMEIAQREGLLEELPVLQQSLQEETAMANFIMTNSPMAFQLLWPHIAGSDAKVVPDGKTVAVAADGTYVRVGQDELTSDSRYVKASQA